MTTFTPDPSPFRDFVERKISFDDYADRVGRPGFMRNPPPSSFEEWRDGARAWAIGNTDLGLMPFQAEDFAQHAAWDGEGIEIKPDSFQKMWDHYITGMSGGPHHVPLDGYDMDLWELGRQRDAQQAMEAAVVERGVERPESERLLAAWAAWFEYGADDSEDAIESFLEDWFSGANSASPHHVPMHREHHEARLAERERVLSMPCYQSVHSDDLQRHITDRLITKERPNSPKTFFGSRFSPGRNRYRVEG